MRDGNHGSIRQQINFRRRQFLQVGDLPFAEVLSLETIAPALKAIDSVRKDRIYTPLVTLRVFLGQLLCADPSCRAAVARLIAHRCSRGETLCSPRTGAYATWRNALVPCECLYLRTDQSAVPHGSVSWSVTARRASSI